MAGHSKHSKSKKGGHHTLSPSPPTKLRLFLSLEAPKALILSPPAPQMAKSKAFKAYALYAHVDFAKLAPFKAHTLSLTYLVQFYWEITFHLGKVIIEALHKLLQKLPSLTPWVPLFGGFLLLLFLISLMIPFYFSI